MGKKKVVFALILTIIVLCVILIIGVRIQNGLYSNIKVNDGNLEEYSSALDGYIPENGYVSDAETAVSIAKAVLDSTFFKPIKGGGYTVEYDKKNEVWIVNNYSIFRHSAYVIISKKDGRIISAWMTK